MARLYGFVAPAELNSGHDPVRVLKVALTLAALTQTLTYDPDEVSFWSNSAVADEGRPPFNIRNEQTDLDELVSVCTLEVA